MTLSRRAKVAVCIFCGAAIGSLTAFLAWPRDPLAFLDEHQAAVRANVSPVRNPLEGQGRWTVFEYDLPPSEVIARMDATFKRITEYHYTSTNDEKWVTTYANPDGGADLMVMQPARVLNEYVVEPTPLRDVVDPATGETSEVATAGFMKVEPAGGKSTQIWVRNEYWTARLRRRLIRLLNL